MTPINTEGHLKLLLLQWVVIIAAAWAVGRLGRRFFNQPLAVGEIAAGILLGPSALGAIWPHDWPTMFPKETQQSLQLLGQLGLVFLLFQVGMEFDFSHLRSKSKTVSAVSICGMTVPILCGLAIGPWLHQHFAPETPAFGFQFFLCIALSISALPIMGRILLEMRLERTAIGVMAISAAAIDDIIGWVLLGIATAMVTANFDVVHLLGGEVIVISGGILVKSQSHLVQIAHAVDLARLLFGPAQGRQQQRGQNRNNGDHHEQFNQRKSGSGATG